MPTGGPSRTFLPKTRSQRERIVARRGAKCVQFRVGINARGLMVRTTYALAYEVEGGRILAGARNRPPGNGNPEPVYIGGADPVGDGFVQSWRIRAAISPVLPFWKPA